MIQCTCGCTIADLNDSVSCSIKGFTREYEPCTNYVQYCKSCYDEVLKDGIVLLSQEQQDQYLEGNKNE
jgi:hypothetical protein